MRVSIPYGDRELSFDVPARNFIGRMDPPLAPPLADLPAALREAMAHPVGGRRLEEIVEPGKKIAVIIDDISRPTPQKLILPILMEKLEAAGARRADIRVVVALGSHRYMTEAELKARVGEEIWAAYPVMNSEFRRPEGLVRVGYTAENVPIMATKAVMETDIHIGVGCMVPHPVMGWGGGGKILFPGVAGEETVAYFHLQASLYDQNLFGLETTPVRDMMETWVDAVGLDFVIDVILNAHQEISDVVAGHYVAAHREGVRRGRRLIGARVEEKADAVIAGSHPADQDFWQSPKAMYAAEPALRGERGGALVLVSPNYEGVGPHPEYPDCMGRDDGDDIVARCIRGENLGDPLAIAVGNSMSKLRRRRRLIVVSDGVSAEDMARCGCERAPAAGLQAVIDDLIAEKPDCRIAVLANGAETFLYE